MSDPRVLVTSTCQSCGYMGSDWLSPLADVTTLRCPLCKVVAGAPRRKLTDAERDFVRWLAREALKQYG